MTAKEVSARFDEFERRLAAVEGTPVVRKSMTTATLQQDLAAAGVAQAQKRATAAAERAQAESAARDARLAAAERIATESAWIRLSAPRGWSSSYPLPAGTRNYRTIQSHGSHELSIAEWRQWLATDAVGELPDAIAAGDLVISPLPAFWGQMDTGARLRNENQWRAARGAK